MNRVVATCREHRPLVVMLSLAGVAYSVLVLARHHTFRSTGFDLGIYDQALWHLSRFEVPESTILGLPSVLGDHLSPVWILLAPVRWIGTDAVLFAQVVLVLCAGVLIYGFAARRFDRRVALCLTGAYVVCGGVQEALWFDVHEVAFAPLLIAAAIWLADRGRWPASFAAAAALVLVKEDLALLVVAFGAWYAIQGRRRLGLACAVLGVAWLVFALAVAVPYFAGDRAYSHWSYEQFGDGPGEALAAIAQQPWRVVESVVTPSAKLHTLAYLFGAFLGCSLLSPICVLALPLLAERLLSSDPKHWTLEDHYSLTLAAVLVLAAIDGLARLSRRFPDRPGLPLGAAVAIAAIAVLLLPAFPLARLAAPGAYTPDAAYVAAEDALATIPDFATVTATNRLLPHLSGRRNVRLLARTPPRDGWVAAALDDTTAAGLFPHRDREQLRRIVESLRVRGDVVFDRDGIVVIHLRDGPTFRER